MASLTFLGAARTVTGSKYLIEHDGVRVLVDCGLFQGLKSLRDRNWEDFPVPPDSITAVVLTHAHLDHVGYLPRLVAAGFRGRAFCTAGTQDLCRLVLPDSGRIQEEDAKQANKHGYTRHAPALPLYDEVADARAVYYRLTTKGVGQTTRLTAIRKGQPVDVALPLIAAPKPGEDDARNISGNNPLDGARISNILPSIADELGIDETEGVAVTSVRSGSAAQTLGFQPGDIIVAVGDKKIDTVIDAEKALSERQRLWQISVKRGNRVVQLRVPG